MRERTELKKPAHGADNDSRRSQRRVLPMFHVYDQTFFYRDLEQNAIDRIHAYCSH
jgi:hypothetical protein